MATPRLLQTSASTGKIPLVRIWVALVMGGALGVLGARYILVGSWLSLLPWTAAGLALGWWSAWMRPAIVGLAFGFALAFLFMLSGYSGSAPVLSRLPGFFALGLVGAGCGLVLAILGSQVRKRIRTSPRAG
jgi:hypothetical protein